jgi:hypothetical protein
VTLGERGINITVAVAVNATGNYVIPILKPQREHSKDCMMTALATASIGNAK